MRALMQIVSLSICLFLTQVAAAENATIPARPRHSDYFPPPESEGGWRTMLPPNGTPSTAQKEKIHKQFGVDWDKLQEAWQYNTTADGATGLVVIRHGYIVGEWYRDCTPKTKFNIHSSSKSFTSLAFGIILADSKAGDLPGGENLTLETKVMSAKYLPQALPLSDPRKADITLRHLLTMTAGFGPEDPPQKAPFEWALGKTKDSAMAQLKGDPGTAFHYSNGGVAHLVLLCKRLTGKDLLPFMTHRVFDPVGMEDVGWLQIGGNGYIGPLSQGFGGVQTNPRDHARFCYMALHRGNWAGKQIVPEKYFDFAWKPIKLMPKYGGLWWVYPRHPRAPKDLYETRGARTNHGYTCPSLDLVFVRHGDGSKFPKGFDHELVYKVIAAIDN